MKPRPKGWANDYLATIGHNAVPTPHPVILPFCGGSLMWLSTTTAVSQHTIDPVLQTTVL